MDTISLFNQQILLCQDEAYTLAWYLLGDAVEAEKTTQAAVEAAFRRFTPHRENCRRLILQQVLRQCQRKTPVKETLPIPGIPQGCVSLTDLERLALVLIEILHLNYPEAALISGCSPQKISRLLAQARRKLIHPGLAHPTEVYPS
jgi:DNA-directed RNA polymerase specialized sigma24 family protein